jgi:hypothetical protein
VVVAGGTPPCVSQSTKSLLLHPAAPSDDGIEGVRRDNRNRVVALVAEWLPTMIEDRLLTSRPETTLNE